MELFFPHGLRWRDFAVSMQRALLLGFKTLRKKMCFSEGFSPLLVYSLFSERLFGFRAFAPFLSSLAMRLVEPLPRAASFTAFSHRRVILRRISFLATPFGIFRGALLLLQIPLFCAMSFLFCVVYLFLKGGPPLRITGGATFPGFSENLFVWTRCTTRHFCMSLGSRAGFSLPRSIYWRFPRPRDSAGKITLLILTPHFYP